MERYKTKGLPRGSGETQVQKRTQLSSLLRLILLVGGAMLDIRSYADFQKTGGQKNEEDGLAVPVTGLPWYFVLGYLQMRVRQEGWNGDSEKKVIAMQV